MTPSHLSKRVNALRNAQCVYSQWRCGEVLLIGPYPRRLGLVPQQECRWCNGPVETVHHLLTDCPAVAHYRDRHGLSLETLRSDSEKMANDIFNFQQHLLATLPPSPIQHPDRVRKRGASEADAPRQSDEDLTLAKCRADPGRLPQNRKAEVPRGPLQTKELELQRWNPTAASDRNNNKKQLPWPKYVS